MAGEQLGTPIPVGVGNDRTRLGSRWRGILHDEEDLFVLVGADGTPVLPDTDNIAERRAPPKNHVGNPVQVHICDEDLFRHDRLEPVFCPNFRSEHDRV